MGNGDPNNGGGGPNPTQPVNTDSGANVAPTVRSTDSTGRGMSSDTKLILGTVIAAIVATGIVVAVVVGTVLGSQIVHNGMHVRELAKRIAEHRDHSHAGLRTEIRALRSELAAGVGPDLVDEMRRDHRRLHDRMHNVEHELSEVDRSVKGLRPDTSTTRTLNERLQHIEDELEKVNRNLQNQNRRSRSH